MRAATGGRARARSRERHEVGGGHIGREVVEASLERPVVLDASVPVSRALT